MTDAGSVRKALIEDGHAVTLAHCGGGALEVLGRAEYDVILSDMRMPRLDGTRLLAALHEHHPALVERVAFVTGDSMSERVKGFLERSGRPHLEKPITPGEIRALVARVVEPR